MDLKLEELASLLNISEQAIKDLVTREEIPYYCIRSEYRFGIEEIENWMLGNQKFLEDINQSYASSKEGLLRYSFFRALYRGNFFPRLDMHSKEELFMFVCQYLSRNFSLDPHVLYELLLDREKLVSTGLGQGIALPHIKDFYLNINYDIIVAVHLESPIEYHALDGLPVFNLFFLFAGNSKSHLNLVNKIVVLNANPEFREEFTKFQDKKQLLFYVKEWETKLKI